MSSRPIADVVASAATHEGWVSARLDPATALASLTPGLEHRPGLRPPRDRNLDLIRSHAGDLEAPAKTSFPHA